MKKILLIIVTLIIAFTLTACSKEYTDISNEELVEMLESDIDYYFIDVRTTNEYDTKRIAGFDINFDFYVFENNSSLLSQLDTSKPVVIMCNSGNRSVKAANIFLDLGFTEVYNLKNGIEGWDGATIN